MPVTKILIANRGEIAERVARTARLMGIPTVAVYSNADAGALHTRATDEAVAIGGNAPSESYLVVDKIIDAAKQTGADAIHPGYGFLSENADFAKRLAEEGLTFIGPPPGAIEVMGDKAGSKRAMIAAGVPTVPGFQGENATDAQLVKEAKSIGFPLMVKASAGGGGRGMRRVFAESELEDAIKTARSEAKNAFGNDELILEKLVTDARHVEVQVFADTHGHTIHLGERDCSLQRRNQKVIEEAPCPVMTPELRAKMGEAAVDAAKAVDYLGAGTVEFLLAENGEFYFLEMNTRLQVEHPVTELVTDLDLVELQIRVARGEPLGLTQDDITLDGHAIEARLYAEDTAEDFLPSSGDVAEFDVLAPARVDTGVEAGDTVSPFYDPMIAKIIVHAPTREAAIADLKTALGGTVVAGLKTNRDFLIELLGTGAFGKGEATTNFIDTHYEGGFASPAAGSGAFKAAALVSHILSEMPAHESVPDELFGWSNMERLATPYAFRDGDAVHNIGVEPLGDDRYRLHSDDDEQEVRVTAFGPGHISFEVAPGRTRDIGWAELPDGKLHLALPATTLVTENIAFGEREAEGGAGSGIIRAPMHGLLVALDVTPGATVKAGDKLGTLEAMKMQHPIRADVDGQVEEVAGVAGEQVASGDLLLRIAPNEG